MTFLFKSGSPGSGSCVAMRHPWRPELNHGLKPVATVRDRYAVGLEAADEAT